MEDSSSPEAVALADREDGAALMYTPSGSTRSSQTHQQLLKQRRLLLMVGGGWALISIVVIIGLAVALGRPSFSSASSASGASTCVLSVVSAVCELRNTSASPTVFSGHIRLVSVSGDGTRPGVTVSINATGLLPNTVHGFHIHEFGDLSNPFALSVGPHYNPTNHPHGCPTGSAPYHSGDMGNVVTDGSGALSTSISLSAFSVTEVLGRAIVLHQQTDDCIAVASAGTRFGVCVIGRDSSSP